MKSARVCEGFITVSVLLPTPDFGQFLTRTREDDGLCSQKLPGSLTRPLTRTTGSHTETVRLFRRTMFAEKHQCFLSRGGKGSFAGATVSLSMIGPFGL